MPTDPNIFRHVMETHIIFLGLNNIMIPDSRLDMLPSAVVA